MGIHHLAFATRDADANHAFYTEAMGFELVKVETGAMGAGWAKHLFYSTGPERDQMIAFWDLHEQDLPEDFSTDIGLGLPPGTNHLAFSADDLDDLATKRDRWLAYGLDVLEIDHDWCVSIYTADPNGWMVEFCTLTRDFDQNDRQEAEQLRVAGKPATLGQPTGQKVYKAADYRS